MLTAFSTVPTIYLVNVYYKHLRANETVIELV